MNTNFHIYYETIGNPQHPCILLVNGLGGQLINWPLKFIDGLKSSGFYVILFDNRDMGLSRYYDECGTPDLSTLILHTLMKKNRVFYEKQFLRAYHPQGFKRQLLAAMKTGSLVEKLKQITIPTCIIHGSHDLIFSIEHAR